MYEVPFGNVVLSIIPQKYYIYSKNLWVDFSIKHYIVNSTLSKQLTIAVINENYPEPQCLWIYADGSKIGMYWHAQAGVYCQEFAHYTS